MAAETKESVDPPALEKCVQHDDLCRTCLTSSHQDHKIRTSIDVNTETADVNDEMRPTVQQCRAKRAQLEDTIRHIASQRVEVQATFDKLRVRVGKAKDAREETLRDDHENLLKEIKTQENGLDTELDKLRTAEQEKLDFIDTSLQNDEALETAVGGYGEAAGSVKKKLVDILKEASESSTLDAVANVRKRADLISYLPSPDRGYDRKSTLGVIIAETPIKSQKRTEGMFGTKPLRETDNPNDQVEEYAPSLRKLKVVVLHGEMIGMAKYPLDHVAVAISPLLGTCSILVYDRLGKLQIVKPYLRKMYQSYLYDLVFQSDYTVFVSKRYTEIQSCRRSGSEAAVIRLENRGASAPVLNRTHLDELLIANGSKWVLIYDSTGTTRTHTVSTNANIPRQVSGTKTGQLLVTSSCNVSPSIVVVYDRDGRAGNPLTAPEGEYLFADVDDNDRVVVASVCPESSTVSVALYDLEGLNLVEKARFPAEDIPLTQTWCYLVSISPTELSLAVGHALFFMKLHYRQ